jgi:hypothetical protein
MWMNLKLNIIEEHCSKQTAAVCPARRYLDNNQDVLVRCSEKDAMIGNENPELDKYKDYELNLDTEDVANKFFKVYQEVRSICAQCKASER